MKTWEFLFILYIYIILYLYYIQYIYYIIFILYFETIHVYELEIYFHLRKLPLGIALSNCYGRRQTPYGDILAFFQALISPLLK